MLGPLHPLHTSFWPLIFAHVLLSAALGTTVSIFQVIWTRPVFPQCPPLPGTCPAFCLACRVTGPWVSSRASYHTRVTKSLQQKSLLFFVVERGFHLCFPDVHHHYLLSSWSLALMYTVISSLLHILMLLAAFKTM